MSPLPTLASPPPLIRLTALRDEATTVNLTPLEIVPTREDRAISCVQRAFFYPTGIAYATNIV
jgi:hypothetical protein